MMSLIRPDLGDLVGKQYKFKMRSYHGVFSTLVLLQVVGILLSFVGNDQYSEGMNDIWINLRYYSGDTIIGFTFLWIFINGILITTRAYREEDFTFVTNRLSSHLANGLFIVTAGVIGGSTSVFSGFVVKVLIRYIPKEGTIFAPEATLSLSVFLAGLFATILFMILCGMAGYLIGMIIQMHSGMVLVLPVLVMGFFLFAGSIGQEDILFRITEFYGAETSVPKLFVKIIVTVGLMFGFTVVLSNRLEVRAS